MFYAFKHHRKAEWIDRACRDHNMSRRDANECTLEELSAVLKEPYVPLRTLPKPSHRRPLPVKKWLVPKEYKTFIVMSKPFEKLYRGWEEEKDVKHDDEEDEDDEDDYFYSRLQQKCDSCVKCPKMKWLKAYHRKHPDQKKIVFMSPEKWRNVKNCMKEIPHVALVTAPHTRPYENAMKKFRDGDVSLMVVAHRDVPYEDLEDCAWIHFQPDFAHKRYASEHHYVSVIKPEEEDRVDELLARDSNISSRLSLDLHRLREAQYEDDESV